MKRLRVGVGAKVRTCNIVEVWVEVAFCSVEIKAPRALRQAHFYQMGAFYESYGEFMGL